MNRAAQHLGEAYVSLAVPLVAATANMVWIKTPWLRQLGPIDGGRCCADGRPVFGPNKTWKGMLGLVTLGALSGWALGEVERGTRAERLNLVHRRVPNTPPNAALLGAAMGAAYGLGELPNSFAKRRLGVGSGEVGRHDSLTHRVFTVVDQVDSVIAATALLRAITPLSAGWMASTVAIGGITHVGVNRLLYLAKLRRTPM